jgi:hypothetical protein
MYWNRTKKKRENKEKSNVSKDEGNEPGSPVPGKAKKRKQIDETRGTALGESRVEQDQVRSAKGQRQKDELEDIRGERDAVVEFQE